MRKFWYYYHVIVILMFVVIFDECRCTKLDVALSTVFSSRHVHEMFLFADYLVNLKATQGRVRYVGTLDLVDYAHAHALLRKFNGGNQLAVDPP